MTLKHQTNIKTSNKFLNLTNNFKTSQIYENRQRKARKQRFY